MGQCILQVHLAADTLSDQSLSQVPSMMALVQLHPTGLHIVLHLEIDEVHVERITKFAPVLRPLPRFSARTYLA